jgi:hypothetical protein
VKALTKSLAAEQRAQQAEDGTVVLWESAAVVAANERQGQPWDRGSSATVTTTTAVGAASQGKPFEGAVLELVAMILASLFVGFLAMVAILYPVLRYGYGCGQ